MEREGRRGGKGKGEWDAGPAGRQVHARGPALAKDGPGQTSICPDEVGNMSLSSVVQHQQQLLILIGRECRAEAVKQTIVAVIDTDQCLAGANLDVVAF